MIEELKDVLYVPVQAVTTHKGKKVCVVASSTLELREVETGPYNNKFVQICRGLSETEKVLLYRPDPLPSKIVLLPKLKEEKGKQDKKDTKEGKAEPESEARGKQRKRFDRERRQRQQ